MEFLSTFIVVAIIATVLTCGALRASPRPLAPKPTKQSSGVIDRVRGWFIDRPYGASTEAGTGDFSRDDLKTRLQALAASKPPDQSSLKIGAMCYEMAMPTGTQDVVCSHCGQKTVFKKDWQTSIVDECRRLVQAINKLDRGLDLRLDSRFFCYSCNEGLRKQAVAAGTATVAEGPTGAIEPPQPGAAGKGRTGRYWADDTAIDDVYVSITFAKAKQPRRVRIDAWGLKGLLAFLQGKDRVSGDTGGETPLKDQLAGLRAILGIEGD